MKNLVKSFDKMPWFLKLILCLPVLNIAWAIYRICKGLDTKNSLMTAVGVIWIFFGTTVLWLIDFVCTVINKRPCLLA